MIKQYSIKDSGENPQFLQRFSKRILSLCFSGINI